MIIYILTPFKEKVKDNSDSRTVVCLVMLTILILCVIILYIIMGWLCLVDVGSG